MADDEDDLSIRRKEVEVDADAPEEEVEKVKRAAFPPDTAYFFRWLESERGTDVVKTITDLIKSAKSVTLDRMGEDNKRLHTRELIDRVGRYVMMGAILAIATVLRLQDKLDTVIIGLLSLALGFLFGRQSSQKP